MWGQTILKTNPKIEKKQHYKKPTTTTFEYLIYD